MEVLYNIRPYFVGIFPYIGHWNGHWCIYTYAIDWYIYKIYIYIICMWMWMCIYLYIVYRDMLDTFGYYKNVWKDKRSLPVPTPIVRFASWQMQQWYSCKMPPPAPAPSHEGWDMKCSAGCVRPILWPSEVNHDKSWHLDVPYFLGKPHKPLLGGFYLHDENQEQNWKIYQPEWRDFTPLRIARGKPNVGFHANNKWPSKLGYVRFQYFQ